MKKNNVTAKVLPMADFRPAAAAKTENADATPARYKQQEQDRGCPILNAIKVQQQQAQACQL